MKLQFLFHRKKETISFVVKKCMHKFACDMHEFVVTVGHFRGDGVEWIDASFLVIVQRFPGYFFSSLSVSLVKLFDAKHHHNDCDTLQCAVWHIFYGLE